MARTDDTGGVYILRPELGTVEKGDMDEKDCLRNAVRIRIATSKGLTKIGDPIHQTNGT